jgi:hypothetical protein
MHDDTNAAHDRRPRYWCRITWASMILVLAGCSYVHTIPIPDEAVASSADNGKVSHDAFHSERGQEIRAYTTRDSVRHAFHGLASVHGDSVQFLDFPESEWGARSAPKVVKELPLDQVLSVDKSQTNVPWTVALFVIFGALVATAIIGSALANQPPIPPV